MPNNNKTNFKMQYHLIVWHLQNVAMFVSMDLKLYYYL